MKPKSPGLAHHLPTDVRQLPQDLKKVVDLWDNLPQSVRAGIVAMVKASVQKDSPD